jgi:hypothetical protein
MITSMTFRHDVNVPKMCQRYFQAMSTLSSYLCFGICFRRSKSRTRHKVTGQVGYCTHFEAELNSILVSSGYGVLFVLVICCWEECDFQGYNCLLRSCFQICRAFVRNEKDRQFPNLVLKGAMCR